MPKAGLGPAIFQAREGRSTTGFGLAGTRLGAVGVGLGVALGDGVAVTDGLGDPPGSDGARTGEHPASTSATATARPLTPSRPRTRRHASNETGARPAVLPGVERSENAVAHFADSLPPPRTLGT